MDIAKHETEPSTHNRVNVGKNYEIYDQWLERPPHRSDRPRAGRGQPQNRPPDLNMGWPFNPLDPFPDIPGLSSCRSRNPPLPDITPIDGGTPKAPVKPVKDTSGRDFLLPPLNYNDDLAFRDGVEGNRCRSDH